MLLDNARVITKGWDGNAHLSVFLEMDVDEDRQRRLADDWADFDTVKRTEVITRAQALDEFKALSRPSATCSKPCRTTRCRR